MLNVLLDTLSYFNNHHLLFPVCCGFTMPTYQTVSQEEGDGDSSSATNSSIQSNKHSYKSKLIYILAFFYFTFSCGMESFFQSQTFTFGICGPHQLKPKEVVIQHLLIKTQSILHCYSGRSIDHGLLQLLPAGKVGSNMKPL